MGWNTHELAWAAGFFDGEGCVTVGSRVKRGIRIPTCVLMSITQNDREVLDRFRAAIDLGTVTGPYQYDYIGPNPFWKFSISNTMATQAAVALLWRWLSTQKREQARRRLLELRTYRVGHYGPSILTANQVREIRARYGAEAHPSGYAGHGNSSSLGRLASEYGVSRRAISHIVHGRNWAHL